MAKKEEPQMKSAYELAMERLDAEQGSQVALNRKQKDAMAEIEQDLKSQIAQVEIMAKQKMFKARQAGDVAKMQEVEDQQRRDLEKIKDKGEARKKEIWEQAGG